MSSDRPDFQGLGPLRAGCYIVWTRVDSGSRCVVESRKEHVQWWQTTSRVDCLKAVRVELLSFVLVWSLLLQWARWQWANSAGPAQRRCSSIDSSCSFLTCFEYEFYTIPCMCRHLDLCSCTAQVVLRDLTTFFLGFVEMVPRVALLTQLSVTSEHSPSC